ncbi:perlucin-like protein [Mya arenaria]|uniref:perlucin-like protein n=1 Tax=Mya arenaria TaxID=6604 RepID=UPI0022E14D2E|nr:perlucin-like protein [Mya arenaria]
MKRLISLLFCLVCIYAKTCCDDGWIGYKGSCYLFGHGLHTFTTAEQYCRQRNGHLVHVNTAEENTFLTDQMRDRKDRAWWLGITDEGSEGVWYWFDTNTLAEFTDFHPGDGGPHIIEDCAVYDPSVAYQWVDISCEKQAYLPLCEARSSDCTDAVVVG